MQLLSGQQEVKAAEDKAKTLRDQLESISEETDRAADQLQGASKHSALLDKQVLLNSIVKQGFLTLPVVYITVLQTRVKLPKLVRYSTIWSAKLAIGDACSCKFCSCKYAYLSMLL